MDWVKQALAQQDQAFSQLQPQAPGMALELREGWSFKGMEFHAYPPPGYEWDSKLIRAIQDKYPDFQPFWVNYVYLSPPEEGSANREYVKFGRNGIGRVISDPKIPKSYNFPMQMPGRKSGYGFKMRRVDRIEDVMRGAQDPRAKDLPGAYMPIDWWLLNWLEENWKEWGVKELRSINRQAEDDYHALAAKKKATHDEALGRARKWMQPILEGITESDLKEYFLKPKKVNPN